MKRNWGLAAVIFAFIVAYQFFVLGPYSKKQIPPVVVQTSEQTNNQKTEALANTEAVTSTGIIPPALPQSNTQSNTQAKEIPAANSFKATEISAPFKISLGSQRSVVSGERGVLKSAILEDFFPLHGKKDDKKELLNDGISIQSTNPKVQNCINSMQRISESPVTLQGASDGGKCEVVFAADQDHRSLLNAKITLDGFSSEVGEIYLRASDSLGSQVVTDQNFLTYSVDSSKKSLREKELFIGSRFSGKVDWLAWGDRYFSTIFIPKGKYNPAIFTDGQTADIKDLNSKSSFGIIYPLNPEKIQGAFSYDYSIYFGTRDPRVLEEIDPVLVESVDLGFFSIVARAMLWALHFLNKLFGNYGISIIALTVIVRLAFWPLNRKAYASSIAMKNIQPEVLKIKEKYGKDSSKAVQMNSEMMALYKKNKVNPLGGCLPMLLQIPIFIGLYGALNHSIDLYGAPFFGWIQNLSDKDPYYVLPALWTVSLIGYMQLNPQATASQPGMPDMKWMFMGMNIFFGYLSASWPAGLTLYLFVSNLVGVTQQVMMKRESNKLSVIQEGA